MANKVIIEWSCSADCLWSGIETFWIRGILNALSAETICSPTFHSFKTRLVLLIFCAHCVNRFSPGHRDRQMAKTGEDDIRGPGWKLQARLFFCTVTFISSLSVCKISLYILSAPKPESGRLRRGQRGKSTRRLTVSTQAVNFCFWEIWKSAAVHSLCLQVLGSLPCWSGRSTKTAW